MMNKISRIHEFAEEIERLNQNPHINPTQHRFIFLKTWNGLPFAIAFAKLPHLLDCYGLHLWCALGNYRQSRVKLRPALKLLLVTAARHFTQKPRFNDLANVLTGALLATGEEKYAVSAESLLQLEKDHPDQIKIIVEVVRKLEIVR